MKRVAAIALLALSAVAAADEEAATARAARFYAAGLETPLLELRRGAMLLETCTTRMRRACSKEQRQLVTRHHTLTLLDELTLFPQRPGAVAVKNAGELKQQIAATGTALMRAAGDYDIALFARYGAALRVCPDDTGADYRGPLDALIAVDLRQFQGLGDADVERARQAIADAETRAVETLRALPAEECDAVLTLGVLLMEMINGKLDPWTHENRRMAVVPNPQFDFDATRKPPAPAPSAEPPTRDVAIYVAGNFVALVATELQLRVFPATAPRIKAIAQAEGIWEAS